MRPEFGNEGTLAPDNLIAGDYPRVTEQAVIASGAGVLTRGTVLGKVTATGKFIKSASAAADGSQTPDRVLAEDVDASAADVTAPTYLSGEFNQRALVLGAGHTIASIKDGLRDKNIYIKGSVAK